MKKRWIAVLMAITLLCGCQGNHAATDITEYYGELSKAQEIAVIPADGSDVEETLTENKDIRSFITALDMEHWELKTLPQTAESVGAFSFSQEETIKFGENAADGELHDVCEIVCYEDISYITLKITGMEITFKVSDTAAEYLNGYF